MVVSTSLGSVSSKESIILKPEHQSDVKVVLVKHHLTSSGEKEKEPNATCSKADVPSGACKRKSFEMAGTKGKNEQCFSGKRRRSVPLTGTMKPSVALVQDLVQHHKSSLDLGRNIYHMQQGGDNKIPSREGYQQTVKVLDVHVQVPSTCINESLDFQRDNQEQDRLANDLHDCNLLPNWLEDRNKDGLLDSSTVKTNGHKSLFPLYDLDLPQVENSAKCKSLFETYHLNRVNKSIVDEV